MNLPALESAELVVWAFASSRPLQRAARTERSGRGHGEQLPAVIGGGQRIRAALRERDSGSDDQVLDGAGDQDLASARAARARSEEHTSELQTLTHLVGR